MTHHGMIECTEGTLSIDTIHNKPILTLRHLDHQTVIEPRDTIDIELLVHYLKQLIPKETN